MSDNLLENYNFHQETDNINIIIKYRQLCRQLQLRPSELYGSNKNSRKKITIHTRRQCLHQLITDLEVSDWERVRWTNIKNRVDDMTLAEVITLAQVLLPPWLGWTISNKLMIHISHLIEGDYIKHNGKIGQIKEIQSNNYLGRYQTAYIIYEDGTCSQLTINDHYDPNEYNYDLNDNRIEWVEPRLTF